LQVSNIENKDEKADAIEISWIWNGLANDLITKYYFWRFWGEIWQLKLDNEAVIN
jgi:hypothetical protein